MKFKKINENKIMVSLSWKELASRNLDVKSLKSNSVAYQKFFWDMMERAQEELGFDVKGSQLMVETVPDTEGNLMITITKSGGEPDVQNGLERLFSELFQSGLDALNGLGGGLPENELPAPGESKEKKERNCYDTFRFDDFEDLIGLAKSVQEGFKLVNKLYLFENAYYLVVKSGPRNQKMADKLFDVAMEFNGHPLESALWLSLLEEQGKKIVATKAIQTLAEKFS